MRAVLSFVVLGAVTEVIGGEIKALGSVLARVGLAVIYVQLTEVSRETSGTETLKSIDFILAVTPIHTRVAGTFIDVFLTALPCIAGRTDTAKSINQVPASSPMLALVDAIIDIDVTILTRPARDAVAIVAADEVSARICIYTGFDFALVCIYLACLASPLGRANTFKSINQILAGSTMPTWVWRAVINIAGTGWSGPSRSTAAFKASRGLHAASTIVARIRQTCVFSYFTVLPRITLRTGTLVFVRACVAAGTSI